MIKWNDEYQVYVSDDGHVYNKDMKEYKYENIRGYLRFSRHSKGKHTHIFVHRLVWQTFNGPIPDKIHVDHIDHIRNNNQLNNLRLVTPSENQANRAHYCYSDFGVKFFEHYGLYMYQDQKLYRREQQWYRNHGKCRWE